MNKSSKILTPVFVGFAVAVVFTACSDSRQQYATPMVKLRAKRIAGTNMVEFNPPAEVINTVQIQSVMSENAEAKTFEPVAQQIPATIEPTIEPTAQPTMPTVQATAEPTVQPTMPPVQLTPEPTVQPTMPPVQLTPEPTVQPTMPPVQPTAEPTAQPTMPPVQPTAEPTVQPTNPPVQPTAQPPAQPPEVDPFLRDCAKAFEVDASVFGLHRISRIEPEHNNETIYSLSDIPAAVLEKQYIAIDLTVWKKSGDKLGTANNSNMDFGELPRNFCVRLSTHVANNLSFKKNCNDARVVFMKLDHKIEQSHSAFESITQCDGPTKENKNQGGSFSGNDDVKGAGGSDKKESPAPQRNEDQITDGAKVVNKIKGEGVDVLTVTPPRKGTKK
jgi:hypothetical protein